MSKNKSSGNSETAKIISEEGELDDVAFDNILNGQDPMDFLFGDSDTPAETEAEESDEVEDETEEEADEEEAEDTEDESTEAEETDDEEEAVEDEEEEEDQEVLSQIDPEQIPEDQRKDAASSLFEILSQEQKAEFMRENGSGVGEENGKLRGKLRKAEDEAKSLREQVEKGLSEIIPTQNSLSKFKDSESLDKEAERITGWRKYLDNLLIKKSDDEFEINGEWISREKLAEAKEGYDVLAEDIPKQRKVIGELSNISELKGSELEAAKAEVSFLSNEDSEQYQEWQKATSDSDFALMATAFPKLGAKLARHIARSIAFQAKPSVKGIKIPMKKAKAIAGKTKGGAAPQKGSKVNKKQLEAKKRIQSGDYDEDDLWAGITL